MAKSAPQNSLLLTSSAPDTSPLIALHPLVILTISDYVTRRILRNQQGPIIGAILGQQNGREITMEVAFEGKAVVLSDGSVNFDEEWFKNRLEQYKTVYSSPQLDLVGWFALGSASGPEPRHLPVHMQIQATQNLESAILLLFHPEMVAQSSKMGGKLPLTLYEGVWINDSTMDIDGPERNLTLKFREAPYSVETGEAEMISLDFVARGGGNATAVQISSAALGQSDESKKAKSKAKESATESSAQTETNGVRAKEASYLSPEDEELLTSLTAKSNAIKMLQSRLNLISSYLQSLPPSYLTDKSIPLDPSNKSLNQPILRSISALLARLPLLTPPDKDAFNRESLQTKSDVELITLLSSLTRTVNDAKELGRKLTVVENGKLASRRSLRGGELGSFHQSEGTFNGFSKEDMDAMQGMSSSGWLGNPE